METTKFPYKNKADAMANRLDITLENEVLKGNIIRCLQRNPNDRPKANDLLNEDYFSSSKNAENEVAQQLNNVARNMTTNEVVKLKKREEGIQNVGQRSNKNFIMKDDKFLLGKSDPNKDEFDFLLFACRDIKEISIPSNIRIISSFAFNFCQKLTKVEIPSNSNLEIIGSNAFSHSDIKKIFIPSKVIKIGESAFHYCYNLNKVEIPSNSNLQTFFKVNL